MRDLFSIICANPWPFAGGLAFVAMMIPVENFGRGIQGDGGIGGDFSDAGGCDDGGGDGGGGD
ncbi:hypothetical protein [Bradyrhizobium sp. USDA 4486]